MGSFCCLNEHWLEDFLSGDHRVSWWFLSGKIVTMTRVGNLENNGGKTVLVGMNLDSRSKELLTWALVKVAQPGDKVIALHVLKREVRTRDNSSVVYLVNTFDTVLSVYEGFCNLKQIDLKIKLSRGPSVRKTLVQEAKAFGALTVIVGVSKTTTLGSSVSIARYCARQLPRNCSVLAARNGKVMFQREALAVSRNSGAVNESRRPRIFGVIHRTLSENSKVLSSSSTSDDTSTNEGSERNSECETLSDSGDSPELWTKISAARKGLSSVNNHDKDGLLFTHVLELNAPKLTCQICTTDSGGRDPDNAAHKNDKRDSLGCEPHVDDVLNKKHEKDLLTLVPFRKREAAPNLISLLIKEMPELRPGWPLLRKNFLPNRGDSSVKETSVVQWAMQLPSRYTAALYPDHKPKRSNSPTTKPCGSNQSQELVHLGNANAEIPKTKYENFPKDLKILCEKRASTCRAFTYEELAQATSQFSSDNLIGRGGSSHVYRGRLSSGKELAVKILKSIDDGWKELLLEIEIITTLKHKNIVSLVGFCFTKSKRLLVYNFAPKGNLEENLHGSKDKGLLGWSERFKVAVGVAKALHYLHSGISRAVVHRDVKSSNILLYDSFEPQLCDFGLAQWASTSHITCNDVAGTFGYLAPEYFMYGKVDDKIDVYSFGVVLLELLSGRKPISNEFPKGQASLVMWAIPLLQKGEFDKILDPCLGDNYDSNQMRRMMLAALMCLRRAPHFRPRMAVVLKLIQGDERTLMWAKFQVNAVSDEFDGLDQEACSTLDIQSILDLALLDVEEDLLPNNHMKQDAQITKNKCLEDYLQRRRRHNSSSFG